MIFKLVNLFLKKGEIGQPLEVDKLVFKGEVKNGFFIEAGAFDSETNSDTLYFEINHNWTGKDENGIGKEKNAMGTIMQWHGQEFMERSQINFTYIYIFIFL